MARTIPPDRFQQLVDCATHVFIERGYAHTQMADVAEAMGVGKGTLYLYVESKEALFDLVVRSADAEHPLTTPLKLPLPTPRPGATLQHVRKRVAKQPPLPALLAALGRKRVADPRAELTEIVREMYHTLSTNRRAIKLMDRSAQFHPELAAVWFTGARGALIGGARDILGEPYQAETVSLGSRYRGRRPCHPGDDRHMGRAPSLGPIPPSD